MRLEGPLVVSLSSRTLARWHFTMLMNEEISVGCSSASSNEALLGGDSLSGLGLLFGRLESLVTASFVAFLDIDVREKWLKRSSAGLESFSASASEVATVEKERSEFSDAASEARRRRPSWSLSDDVGDWNSWISSSF